MKTCWVFLLAAFILGLLAGQPALSAPAPETFRVADIYPDTHPIYRGSIKWWIEQMESRSQGRFKAKWFGNATLAAGPDIAKTISDGTVHMGNCLYASTLVPLQDVVALPNAFEDNQVVAATKAYNKLVRSGLIYKQYEKLGIEPLFGFTVSNYQIFTTGKPIANLNDFKGMKIRTAGTTQPRTVALLGGVPVNMAIAEATDALQKGVVSGISIAIPSLKPYPFYDLMKNGNLSFNLGGFPVIYGMNKAVWESLPADIRTIMEQLNEETPIHAAEFYLNVVEQGIQEFKNKGMKIYTLTPAEMAQIRTTVRPVWKEWADYVEAKGSPGKQMVEDFKAALHQNGIEIQ